MTLNTTHLGAQSPLPEGGKSLRIPIERTAFGSLSSQTLGVIDMSYTLQAVIAKSGALPESLPFELARAQLQDGFELVPVTSKVRDIHGIAFCPLTDEGDEELPLSLLKLCELLSASGEVAYIEAEIFGGAGMQAHALFAHGKAIGSPVVSQTAINAALSLLGAKRGQAADEFESVGLGLHRDTDLWAPRA